MKEAQPISIDMNHPLRGAQWVWPDTYMYLHNHFAQFRWDIELASAANRVPFYITADKSYRLYVNGQSVCRGPARGYQSHWPFDEIDLAELLHAGHNWISVEAYQPGCSTFQYLHQNYAGLLVATDDPALRAAMTAGAFTMRRSPGHLRDTARYSYQIDFQEHLDLRLDDRAWIHSADAPQGWRPDIMPDVAQKMRTIPFGRPPYNAVEPRGIPMLREAVIIPALPTVMGRGASHAGYLTAANVSWHWVSEGRAVSHWDDAAPLQAATSDSGMTFTLPPTGMGQFCAVVIPAGQYVLGTIDIEVEGAAGGEIIDIQHDQTSRDGRAHFITPGDACIVAMANRIILRAGVNRHEFFHPLGFGTVTLIARDTTEALNVRLKIRTVEYPFTMGGTFECSDPLLNAIHAACRRTQQLCASDAYVDTPWREQAQWWGDARVQAKNTFYLDGDARLLARGIRSVAGQNVLGLTPGHAPTSGFWCVLPDFALTWILTLWDYYWQTGDISLFKEQYARAGEVLDYFDTGEARHAPTGLLRHDHRFWLFEDWADLPKESVPTFLNLWYVLTLRHLASLCEAAGKTSESAGWSARASEHAALTVKHCFDPAGGSFHPVLAENGTPYGPPSVHDQTLALMLNLQPEAHHGIIEQFLLPYLRQKPQKGAVPSAFWSTYVLEEVIARGYSADAIAFIRRRWEPMLSTGTTWEGFTWTEESSSSASHAWSAHPCFHVVNALAGVTQTAPGWSHIALRPALLPDVNYARAAIPSPRGVIRAEWSRSNGVVRGTLTAPPTVQIETDLKLTKSADAHGEAAYHWEVGSNGLT